MSFRIRLLLVFALLFSALSGACGPSIGEKQFGMKIDVVLPPSVKEKIKELISENDYKALFGKLSVYLGVQGNTLLTNLPLYREVIEGRDVYVYKITEKEGDNVFTLTIMGDTTEDPDYKFKINSYEISAFFQPDQLKTLTANDKEETYFSFQLDFYSNKKLDSISFSSARATFALKREDTINNIKCPVCKVAEFKNSSGFTVSLDGNTTPPLFQLELKDKECKCIKE